MTIREEVERVAKAVDLQWQIHKNPYPVKFDRPIPYDKGLADALEEIATLRERVKVAKEALEFYGRVEHDPQWPRKHFDILWLDGGEKARAALAKLEE